MYKMRTPTREEYMYEVAYFPIPQASNSEIMQNCIVVTTTVEILINSLKAHIELKHLGSSFQFCWWELLFEKFLTVFLCIVNE